MKLAPFLSANFRVPNYDIFLACPLSDPGGGCEVAFADDLADRLARTLRALGLSVFFAGTETRLGQKFRVPNFSLNLNAIKNSAVFIVITAEREVSRSSIWVESGVAFALNIPSMFIAPELDSLPFLVRRALAPIAEGGQKGVLGFWVAPSIGAEAALTLLLPKLLDHLGQMKRFETKIAADAQ